MWTKAHRARQLAFARRCRYPADAEWEQIKPLLPRPARRGRARKVDLCEILNAIRYMARSGCGWRMLPVHFDPWETVYWWFRRLMRRLLFQTVHDVALMLDREQAGHEASPSAGVVDSQTVKAPHAPGGGGYDAAKKVKGRKRHVAVDTDERLLMVNLTTADVQEAQGTEAIVKAVRRRWPWLRHLFADGAYDRGTLASLAAYKGFMLEVARKLALQLRSLWYSDLMRGHGTRIVGGWCLDRGDAGAVGCSLAGGEGAPAAAVHAGTGRRLGGRVP